MSHSGGELRLPYGLPRQRDHVGTLIVMGFGLWIMGLGDERPLYIWMGALFLVAGALNCGWFIIHRYSPREIILTDDGVSVPIWFFWPGHKYMPYSSIGRISTLDNYGDPVLRLYHAAARTDIRRAYLDSPDDGDLLIQALNERLQLWRQAHEPQPQC